MDNKRPLKVEFSEKKILNKLILDKKYIYVHEKIYVYKIP